MLKNRLIVAVMAFTFLASYNYAFDRSRDMQIYLAAKKDFYNGNYRAAIEKYRKLIQSYQNSQYVADAHFWLGYSYEKLDKPRQAIQQFQTVIKKYPDCRWNDDSQRKIIELASVLMLRGDDSFRPIIVSSLNSQDPNARLRAIIALSQIGDERALSAILQDIKNERVFAVRLKMLDALSRYQSDKAIPVLEEMLSSEENTAIKTRAFAILAGIDDPATVPVMKEYLTREKNENLRLRAIYTLEDANARIKIPVLLQVLQKDASENVRLVALNFLEDMEDPEVTDGLFRALETEKRQSMRLRILSALGSRIDESTVPHLQELIKKEGPEIRLRILNMLDYLPGKKVVPLIGYIIEHDRNEAIRQKAISMLDEYDSQQVVPLLINVFPNEPDKNVRLQILNILSETQDKDALKVVALALDDQDSEVKLQALNMLDEFGSSIQPDLLLKCLRDQNAVVRLRGLEHLEERADEKSIPVLQDILENGDDTSIKLRAIDILSNIDTDSSRAVLCRAALTNKEATIRLQILTVFQDIGQASDVNCLARLLKDNNIAVRLQVLTTIAEIGGKRAVPILRKASRFDTDATVRQKAFQLLYYLDRKAAQKLRGKTIDGYY